MLNKENIQDVLGLAPMQMGMLLHHARHTDTTAYIEQFDFVMAGSVDEHALQKAFEMIVRKYSVLRTIFSYRKTDTPKQLVMRKREAHIDVVRLGASDQETLEQEVDRYKDDDKKKGFDLSKDLLIRIALLQRSDDKCHVILTFHHIIMDGWCLGLVFGDLFKFYDAVVNHNNVELESATGLLNETHPYAEYIRWLERCEAETARTWWKEYLSNYETPVGLPWFDMPQDIHQVIPKVHKFSLGDTLSQQLQSLAQKHQLTFNAVFQAAWGVVLQKFNNTKDVIFGSVVSGRPPQLTGVQEMVGLFINTLPLRVNASEKSNFLALAKQVGSQIFVASAYEHFPLYEIQQLCGLKNQLINHVVAFENYPIADQLRALTAQSDCVTLSEVRVEEQSNYDFNLIVNPGANTQVTFSYNAARFSQETMQMLERSLLSILVSVADNPEVEIDFLTVCSSIETQRVLKEFNHTPVEYPRDSSLVDQFLLAANLYPDQIAISSVNEKLSYRDLQAQVAQVAAGLQLAGVQPGARVALFLPRGTEVLLAILGCLSVGAVYVPLDMDTPAARLEFIIADANVSLIIASERQTPSISPHISRIEIERLRDAGDSSSEFVPVEIDANHGAYIMYTSGSTGKAKGCCVTHRNIIRLVKNTNFAKFDQHQVILSTSSPVFDASTFEYWGALLNGGCLCLYDNSHILDPVKLKALILQEQVTTMWLTSALFNQLVEADISLFQPLQQLLVGGEVLSLSATGKLIQAHPHIALINGYGPTENTTFSATYRLTKAFNYRVPIGKPIANSSCYILDAGGQLLPPGAYGELCVGGDGVSAGYLNRDDLNLNVFLDNPFASGRLYRTGDVARWLPDGNIDLLGRKDFQYKIRGYRVELGEIESAINSIPGVCESVVQVRDVNNNKQLHAWYVSDNSELDEKATRLALLQQLPRYMLPDHLKRLEKFPLNINGKIDRHALPDINVTSVVRDDLVLPRNEQQALIADICRDVLGIDQLSIFDNFFEMGANSINLITINNRIKKALDKDIPITAMFEHTSVHKLAEFLNPNQELKEQAEKAEQASLNEAKANLLKSRKLKRMAETV